MKARPARACAALGLALLAGPAAADTVLLAADTLTLNDGVATGEGHVHAELGLQRASGERFTYDLSTGTLTLSVGRWERPEGSLDFTSAVLDLGDGTGVVVAGSFRGRDGRLRVEGEELVWTGTESLEGQDVTFSTCVCETPTWQVTARAVTVRLDDVAEFRGGWVEICERRVLPVPWGRIPLAARRSGLLAPQVGWGEDGFRLGLPVYLTMGRAADLTLTPELRVERSARLLGEFRYALGTNEGGVLALAGGYDELADGPRGAVDWIHRWEAGPVRMGADVQRWSDARYEADYGDSYFSRAAPWSEALAFAGVGPARVETDTFQADTPLGQRPVAGELRAAGLALGPVSADASARVDLIAPEGFEDQARLSRVRARLALAAGRSFGPVRTEAAAEARAIRWSDARPWAEGRLRGAALLPLWAGGSKARWLMDVGLAGQGSAGVGEAEPLLPEDEPAPPWAVGPLMSIREITAGGVPLSARAALELREDGLFPWGEARFAADAWSGKLQADPDLQELSSTWDDGRGRLALGVERAGELVAGRWELAWTLPAPVAAFRPGWHGVADLAAPDLQSQGPSLRWRPGCECVSADLSLTFSEDQTRPDAAFHFEIW